MNAARLEIARRLVACPKWVWLPGMREAYGDRVVAVSERDLCLAEEGATCDDNYATWVPHGFCVPDLDDDVTRLSVLAVVRRVSGDDGAYTMNLTVRERVRWIVRAAGREFAGPTEIEAILAALEAAPQ